MKTAGQVATVALVVFLQLTLVDGSVQKWFQDSKNPQQTLTECMTTATVQDVKCSEVWRVFERATGTEMSFFMVPNLLFDPDTLDQICLVEDVLLQCLSQCSIGLDRAPTTKEFMATSIYKTICTEDNKNAFKQASVCLNKTAVAGGVAECQTNDRCGSYDAMLESVSSLEGITTQEQLKAKIHGAVCNFASCISRCQKGILERACTAAEAGVAARITTTDGIEAFFNMFKQQMPAEVASSFPSDCYTRSIQPGSFEFQNAAIPPGGTLSTYKSGSGIGTENSDIKEQFSGKNWHTGMMSIGSTFYYPWRSGNSAPIEWQIPGSAHCAIRVSQDDPKLGRLMVASFGSPYTHIMWTCIGRANTCCGLECCPPEAKLKKRHIKQMNEDDDDFFFF